MVFLGELSRKSARRIEREAPKINFEKAARAYTELRQQIEAIEAEAKGKVAILKTQLLDIETWLTMKADEQGLVNIKTSLGTAYWSNIASAKVADRAVLFDYIKEHDAFDLLESRVSKEAVKSHMEAHGGLPPPGVDFSQIRRFNFRAEKPDD